MAPWIVGAGLAQIGEFSFVLARNGLDAKLLSKTTYNFALTCTVLTMALSPLVSAVALPIGRGWQRWRKSDNHVTTVDLPNHELRGHVVIAGYGRTGRAVARALQGAQIPLVVTEWDHAAFSDANHQGLLSVLGDIAREEILNAAQIKNARVMVLTIPDQGTIRLSAERARAMNPSVILIARAVREHNVAELQALGVNATVQPEFEGGIEMFRQALVSYTYDDMKASRLIAGLRADLYGHPR